MMRMDNRLVQTQSQRLMLTQKMQQALQILQYNAQELDQHVQDELEQNPVLEMVEVKNGADLPEPDTASSPNGHDDTDYNDADADIETLVSPWEQRMKEGRDLSVNPDLADRREFYQNSITKDESLQAHLITQLRMAFDDDRRYAIGERIIGEIDDRGYFQGDLEALAEELQAPESEVERVLYRIQRFDPVGVGARDIEECLLLQINADYPDDDELRTLVQEHFDALQHRQIPKIAKAMGTTPEHVEDLRRKLSTLDPWPGLEYASEPTQYVAPDLAVEKVDGEWRVFLTAEGGPNLVINDDYRDLARKKGIEKGDKAFLRDKLESAKWLIRNIEQRGQTILKVGTAIMEFQKDFLEKGIDAIRPLTLQEVADVVGVHEATVSRTTRGKYIQTPQGLFELKFFFSPGLKSATGEDQSSKSVQQRVRKIIEEEDKRKPLSDQKIAERLKQEGLTIARRTVTKYREQLGIPATTMRREY